MSSFFMCDESPSPGRSGPRKPLPVDYVVDRQAPSRYDVMIRHLFPKEAYIQFKAFGMAAVSLCSPADLSAAPSPASEDARLRALAEEFAAIEKRGYLGVEASAALTARMRDELSQERRGRDAAS